MENTVLIDLERYNELLIAEHELQLAKQILFNKDNRLNYSKKYVQFMIDEGQVKLVFPCDYNLHYQGIYKKEEENV